MFRKQTITIESWIKDTPPDVQWQYESTRGSNIKMQLLIQREVTAEQKHCLNSVKTKNLHTLPLNSHDPTLEIPSNNS